MDKYHVELTYQNTTDIIQSCIHYREYLKTLVTGGHLDYVWIGEIKRIQEIIDLMIDTSQIEGET